MRFLVCHEPPHGDNAGTQRKQKRMSKHEISILPSTAPGAIDALSVAAEFLMCAIRAAAWDGLAEERREVRQSITWALAKIEEADALLASAGA